MTTATAPTLDPKIAALLDRPDSEKGFKDAREVLRLLELGVSAGAATRILVAASASTPGELPSMITEAFDLLGPRSGANKTQRERIRRWKREWVAAVGSLIDPGQRERPSLE